MKPTLHVEGRVLRDKTNPAKRNYVNLLLTIMVKGEAAHVYHLTNYAANSSSLKHVLQVKTYTRYSEAERAYQEKHKSKLARDRAEWKIVDQEFDPLDDKQMAELSDQLSSMEMKVEIAKAKSLTLGIAVRAKHIIAEKSVERRRDEDELDAVTSMADGEEYGKAVSDDALLEMESKTTFGKETSKTNKNWGMF